MYAAPPFEVYSEHLLFITPKTTSNKCETNHENDKEERKKTCFIEFHLLR
jgi:hypothetical protein